MHGVSRMGFDAREDDGDSGFEMARVEGNLLNSFDKCERDCE